MNTGARIRLAAIAAALISSAITAIPSRTATAIPSEAYPPKSPINEIVRVAKDKGIDPDHLLAISAQESSLGRFKSGDAGCSRGWFHINLCANPNAKNIIGNPASEAGWVANRLIGYGYLEGKVTLAFARYNSPTKPNYAYAQLVEKRIHQLDSFLEQYR